MLLKKLPGFYRESDYVKGLQGALEKERKVFEDAVKKLINDLFVISSETISLWESLVGIKSNETIALEYRRSNVLAKMRGKGTTTVGLIKNVAESYSNGKVEVIEDNANYKFTVKFVGTLGIPPNIDDLKAAINDVKPAHLVVEYELTYNTWDMAKKLTWEQAKVKTWTNIREDVI